SGGGGGSDIDGGRGVGGTVNGAGAHTGGGGGGSSGVDGGRGVGGTADGAGASTGGGGGGGGSGADGGRGVGGTADGAGARTGGGGGVGDRLPWGVEHQSGTENAGRGPFSLHSVHFDGCFKLNQIKRKSRCKHPDSTSVVGNVQYTRNYTQLSRRRYTIRNDLVEALEASGSGSADIGRNTDCSNFTADKVLAQESVKNLITAAGVVVCRHGMLFRLLSFFHGERHLYSTAAAQSFFCVGTAVQLWWYDIACRWSKSFQKWLQCQDGADVALKEKGKDMVCLIPPWHSHAHSYDCQKAFGHLGQAGAGRGTGEVAEIFNSQVGPHGKTLRYMSPVHRESVLEDVGRRYCRQVELGLPARVQRMQFRAKAALEAAGQRVAAMEAGLGPDKVAEAQELYLAQQQQRQQHQPAKRPRGQDEAAVTEQQSWKPVYARCRLALQKLERVDTVDAPADAVPFSVLVEGGDALTVRQRPGLVRALRSQLVALEDAHSTDPDPPASWAWTSDQFKGALAELVDGEIKKLCTELEGHVLDYHSLEQVIQHLRGRKKEQDYAKKEKRRTNEHINKLWAKLESWCKVDAGQEEDEKSRNDAILSVGALAKAKKQQFPWGLGGGVGGALVGMPRMVATLLRSYNQVARAEEELCLLSAEVERACLGYTNRVAILNARLDACTEVERTPRLLLSLHLKHHTAMLSEFTVLKAGGTPADPSYLGNIDADK
ncbi:hypothetical protein TSOC_004846, partial [Tetrabaena socialis]